MPARQNSECPGKTSLQGPTGLKTEYFENPIGLDTRKPHFSWLMSDARRGAHQTGYQVRVTTGAECVWDSGKVTSDRSIQIEYGGAELRARQCYKWKVRIWDHEDAVSDWSNPGFFEIGLWEQANWSARMIQTDVVKPWEKKLALIAGKERNAIKGEDLPPAPFLRKEFRVDKDIVRARIYVTALGIYELYLNGRRIGEDCFTPGWTDYATRVQYQAYDITGMLQQGGNAIGAILGEGWYCGHVAWWGRQHYGDRPKLLAQIEVNYADGTSEAIVTDGSWKWHGGPIVYSDMLEGECYDARLEMPGWDMPAFNAAEWHNVTEIEMPDIVIVACRGPRVHRMAQISAIRKTQPTPGVWVFDLGQNMTGHIRLKAAGPAGMELTIRHAEMLNRDGTIYTENLRSAHATDRYIMKGENIEIWEPRFTFHGFRYVEVTGYPGELDLDAITGIVVHSDTPATGKFECSDQLICRLQENILWSQRSNFLEVPTDCPQRDERLGWSGDAQLFMRTAAFNMDVAAFFSKWLTDLNDSQLDDGRYTNYSPSAGDGSNAEAGWADAGIICPWILYICYGDIRVLKEHYPNMRKWIAWQESNHTNYIRHSGSIGGYGDWLNINALTPRELINTVFFAYSSRLMSKIAAVLGRKEEAVYYNDLFQKIKQSFNDKFVMLDGRIAGNTQTAYVLALHFDLLPEDKREAAVEFLVNDIRLRGNSMTCGIVGAAYVNLVLTRFGRLDVAYDLLNRNQCPSWIYPVTRGATTIWERWDGWTDEIGFQDPSMNSFNHYVFGSIGQWLYSVVAGLELDEEHPAGKHVIIRPRPGGGLTWAWAALESPCGRVETGWELQNSTLVITALIPANTRAMVHIPTESVEDVRESGMFVAKVPGLEFRGMDTGCAVFQAPAGSYRFEVRRYPGPSDGNMTLKKGLE